MGLPREFNNALHKRANFYAAWFPVATPYQVGDYGVISNGVFQKTGHLNDLAGVGFNVQITKSKGDPVSIDFLSEGAKAIKLIAGATVQVLPENDVTANIKYEFNKKNSFVVKATDMVVERMDNVQQVASALARLRRDNKWHHNLHVVSATYTGQNCLVLLSTEANTTVEFEASAAALKKLDIGNLEVKPSVTFSNNSILHSIGKTGPIGLNLFKLKFLGSGLDVLPAEDLSKEEQQFETDWGSDLQDEI